MDEARNLSYQAFFLFPARLKLVKGSAYHIFNVCREADTFLGLEKEDTAAETDVTTSSDSGPVGTR